MGVEPDFAWEVECPPASFELVAVRPSFIPDSEYRRVYRAMRDCKPAGKTMTLIEALGGYHGPASSRHGAPPTALTSRIIYEAGP